jgi:MATE family multidrug resistance protein
MDSGGGTDASGDTAGHVAVQAPPPLSPVSAAVLQGQHEPEGALPEDIPLDVTVGLGDDDDEYLTGVPPWSHDATVIARIAGVTSATQLFRVSSYTVVLMMIGPLGEVDFGAVALAMTLNNMFTMSPCMGIASVLDTLVTQEYGRCSTSALMGLHLRRAFAACCAWVALMTVVFALCATWLCSMVFGDELGPPTATFLKLSFLWALPLTLSTSLQKFLSAQHVVDVALYGQLISIITIIGALYVAVPYGVGAVAVAAGVGRFAGLVAMFLLAHRRVSVTITYGQWTMTEVLERVECEAFLHNALPSIAATCAERWSFETMSIMAGLLGPVAVSAWAVLFNVWILLFTPTAGFYAAASTLVGNALGAGRPSTAKRYARRTVMMNLCVTLVIVFLFACSPRLLLRLYPTSLSVHQAAASIAPTVALSILFDTTAYCLQGTLRAAGDIKFVARLTMGAQWAVSVTAAGLLLAIWRSMWAMSLGLTLGCFVQCLGAAWRVRTTDWLAASSRRTAVGRRHSVNDADLSTSVATGPVTPAAARQSRHSASNVSVDESEMAGLTTLHK